MSLGAPEVLLILATALIVFGPRKLPEQSMAQFRHADEREAIFYLRVLGGLLILAVALMVFDLYARYRY